MNWTCPYCNRDQVITGGQQDSEAHYLQVGANKYGECGIHVVATACANKSCGEVTLIAYFGPGFWATTPHRFVVHEQTFELYQLRPASSAKPQPETVPQQLAKDYYEACAIRNLSPKASATLSRRVLQGMIRDFCGVKGRTLFAEIEELKKMADAGTAPQGVAIETIDAMHHIRSIGNIGAHMEKDIDVIVDVEGGEAQALIELIEMLFEDWYIERARRQQKLASLRGIAEAKDEAKRNGKKPDKQ